MEKYQFVQRLGQGSFAVVWKARRKSDSRLVAVKQLRQSPESWDACKALPEVRSASAISDRRYVTLLLEAVRHGGELFIVFEYMESSLHACTTFAGQRLDEPQVRWAARRLLAGLAAVHQAGLAHCDVKPENILVGTEGGHAGRPTMKLCDFGQATDSSQVRAYVGTRWYRPPELLLGSRGDLSIDLWAAGCTIAELFLRRPLLPGTDVRDMCFRICGEIGPPDDDWPLAAKLIESSGRANAEAAAWRSLAEAGASEAGVQLVASLLTYDGARRQRADRALREAFFAGSLPEAAIALPPARPMSPETLTRQRDEAAVAERKIRRAGSGAPPASSREASAQPEEGARQPSPSPAPASQFEGPRQVGRPGGYEQGRAPLRATRLNSGSSVTGRGFMLDAAGSAGRGQGAPRLSPPASPVPLPSGAKPLASPPEIQAEGHAGDGDSDEALAEMFWGVCKAGSNTPARSPDGASRHSDSEDEANAASPFVPAVAERGRARRVRRLEPGS